jgi:hypothetical protein
MNTNRLMIACGCIFHLFLSGCLEEKEPDVRFSFNSPRPNEIIFNTTPIGFTLPSSFTGTVEVQVDGKVIGSAAAPPYRFDWSTRDRADGNYSLLAVATSQDGQRQETIQEVVVRNNLLTFNVPARQIPAGMRAYVFISDAMGKVIAWQEFKNNSSVIIPGPEDFNGSSFMVSEAYLASPDYLQVYSVSEMNRGEWTLTPSDLKPPFVGEINISSESTPASLYYVSASGDFGFVHQQAGDLVLATNRTPSQLFIRDVGQAVNQYTLLKNVNVGSSLSFPFSQLSKPLTHKVVPLSDPGVISTRVRLYGFPKAGDPDEYYPLGVFFRNGQEIDIEFPDKEFEWLGSESYYRNKQVRLYSFQPDRMHDFKTLNAQIYVSSPDGQRVDLSTYGDFDMYMAAWMYFSEQTGAFGSWLMIGPPGRNQQLRLPILPNEILQQIPAVKINQLNYTGSIQVSDYGSIKGYFDYRQFVATHGIAGPYKFGNAWKEQLFTESGFTGGRISIPEPAMLVEHLKIVQ